MSTHETSTQYFNSSNSTRVTCTCGWMDRWAGSDGSAQQSGSAHEERMNRLEARA